MKRVLPTGVQTGIRLPRDMHERLSKSELGVSEEIRRRVNQTLYYEDSFDAPTRELADAVMWMADQIKRDTGSGWQNNSKAAEALAEAIRTLLEMNTKTLGPAVSDLFGPDDPETLGRSIARHYRRFKEEMEKSDREIAELHKGNRS